MQIDIDFEVFKALTSHRLSESDSYNAVIRRLLGLSPTTGGLADNVKSVPPNALADAAAILKGKGLFGGGRNALAPAEAGTNFLATLLGGVWFGNVHFPEGTRFRANYKGQSYFAEIEGGQWIGSDGKARRSPSDAASAISNTNVNGWRFWQVQMPGDPAWRKLDELKQ